MFNALFDESKDVFERLDAFQNAVIHSFGEVRQWCRTALPVRECISTYLWLRYPDKYYIYKFGEVKKRSPASLNRTIVSRRVPMPITFGTS
jgi:5-methylcytosine-specific restriction protein B